MQMVVINTMAQLTDCQKRQERDEREEGHISTAVDGIT